MNKKYRLNNTLITRGAAVAIFLASANLQAATDEAGPDDGGPEIRACVDRALPELSMKQNLTVHVVGRSGRTRETTRTLHWKRFEDGFSKALIRIIAPVNEAGLAVLLLEREGIEPNIFMFTPELQRSRRVAGGAITGSIMGTAYSRIRTYMDKELCLPMKSEFYGINGSLDKELWIERDAVKPVGNRQIPFRTVMTNHKNGTHSEFIVEEAQVDPDLRDSTFTRSELKRGYRGR